MAPKLNGVDIAGVKLYGLNLQKKNPRALHNSFFLLNENNHYYVMLIHLVNTTSSVWVPISGRGELICFSLGYGFWSHDTLAIYT